MELLYEIRDKLNVNDEEFHEVEEEIRKIETLLSKREIILNKQLRIGLYSHISSFLKRLRSGEKVMKIGNEVVSQLSDRSMDIAKEIVGPMFDKYNTKVDNSEVILVAIYIQTAINGQKGGESNGR